MRLFSHMYDSYYFHRQNHYYCTTDLDWNSIARYLYYFKSICIYLSHIINFKI
eukprot:UN04817